MEASQAALTESTADWDSELLRALYQLVFSSPDREVAGVLVGSPAEQSETGLPVVRAAIPATQGFVPGEASMFAHITWAHINETMARYYPGLETVGWYVSRPGHGTGLIPQDVANHARWFGRPGQILLVVDSLSHRAALYADGRGGLVQLTEGPVARRYTHAPKPGFPYAATGVLALGGVTFGALAFLIAQALGG